MRVMLTSKASICAAIHWLGHAIDRVAAGPHLPRLVHVCAHAGIDACLEQDIGGGSFSQSGMDGVDPYPVAGLSELERCALVAECVSYISEFILSCPGCHRDWYAARRRARIEAPTIP